MPDHRRCSIMPTRVGRNLVSTAIQIWEGEPLTGLGIDWSLTAWSWRLSQPHVPGKIGWYEITFPTNRKVPRASGLVGTGRGSTTRSVSGPMFLYFGIPPR